MKNKTLSLKFDYKTVFMSMITMLEYAGHRFETMSKAVYASTKTPHQRR